MDKSLLLIFMFITGTLSLNAQSVGIGYVSGLDFYQRIKNPTSENYENSVGNAILNFSIGPKIWIGNTKYSLSVEGQVNIAATAYDTKKYRGIGALSFPLMAKFNTKSLSGFAKFPFPGISIGGGIQYSLTDLLFVADENKSERGDWIATYIIEIGVGLGMNGKEGALFVRYGFGDEDSNVLHVGMLKGLNYTVNSKYKKNKKKQKTDKKDKKKALPVPF